jgi:cytoskeletal protein RodZ
MRVKITRTPLWEWVRGAAELWRCRVPIGETLAEARQRAGLTVAQVSEQTCIREALIKAVEGGDYSDCGGDFYARADIRSIAKAVGADPGPLIAEYDALYRAGPPATHEPGGPGYRPRGRWLNRVVVLGLVVVLGFGVYSRLAGSRHAAAAPPTGGKHAVTHQPAGPGGPGPAPKLTHAAVTPAPAPTVTHAPVTPAPAPTVAHAATAPAPAAVAPAQTLTPAAAGSAGPGGGSPPPARRVTGGSGGGGPAHRPAHHRSPARAAVTREPAHGKALPSRGHGGRDRHRRCASAAGRSGQHRPSGCHDTRPEGHA